MKYSWFILLTIATVVTIAKAGAATPPTTAGICVLFDDGNCGLVFQFNGATIETLPYDGGQGCGTFPARTDAQAALRADAAAATATNTCVLLDKT